MLSAVKPLVGVQQQFDSLDHQQPVRAAGHLPAGIPVRVVSAGLPRRP
jgi:hypothetical protein